jgi:hypothetical protein
MSWLMISTIQRLNLKKNSNSERWLMESAKPKIALTP